MLQQQLLVIETERRRRERKSANLADDVVVSVLWGWSESCCLAVRAQRLEGAREYKRACANARGILSAVHQGSVTRTRSSSWTAGSRLKLEYRVKTLGTRTGGQGLLVIRQGGRVCTGTVRVTPISCVKIIRLNSCFERSPGQRKSGSSDATSLRVMREVVRSRGKQSSQDKELAGKKM
ncbi:hypothetical protein Baya_2258 [Bagarius yarrelli]|uniref:Uncharacterized protein n=1 Tax=Bagarius yarrelli TaxID=175774 RepID=A0A556TNF8_BAGYA|nr:hypothetical protein Baya_2258 [Bagarius yarrelli]